MKRLLARLSAILIRAIGYTLRMTLDDRGGILNRPDHPPIIIAFWHNRTALMALFQERYCQPRTTVTFISRSRDGQFMTDVATEFGLKAVRGSSSRHGVAAALTAIRAAQDARVDLAITPDGPRGPRYQIRSSLLRLAQATGRPIVAVTYQLAWKYELKSWDRFHIPVPFSTCRLMTLPPIHVSPEATDSELSEIEARVTEALGGD